MVPSIAVDWVVAGPYVVPEFSWSFPGVLLERRWMVPSIAVDGVVTGGNEGQNGRGLGETVVVGPGRTEIGAVEVRIFRRWRTMGMGYS
jgi:hypothetical protein